ncbi:YciC family protein [Buchnera aphidicola]|uniref:UPF0259 membrane protein FQV32_01615 n=1 Tax=Buchnera aphidicola (Aphis gossypii) TaxID=98785 RepID=A0A5J6ZC26_9GAMM|nr:YciC family protein [Buchnera aphidicola]QFQ32107.1 UPF0259 family protein [Buchnera aphidicola (Aphis gossypii)]UPT14634.1 UPF0259 family protein [Buchnera aphidicola (Aphis gossypii)]
MFITIRELYNDTSHFVSKEIKSIFFISIISTLISIIINILIKPDMHIISMIENNRFINSYSVFDFINNMSEYEKKELLKYSIFKIIEFLTSKTFLLGSIITLITYLSSNKQKRITLSLMFFIKIIPSLFILNCITNIIIQIGFMFFIIPGIFLSILLALSPIILSFQKNTLMESIRLSISISWKYINIVGTGVLFWMCVKFISTKVLLHFHFINKNFIFFILNVNINIFFSILTIYLFRFYMLLLRT